MLMLLPRDAAAADDDRSRVSPSVLASPLLPPLSDLVFTSVAAPVDAVIGAGLGIACNIWAALAIVGHFQIALRTQVALELMVSMLLL